MRRNASSSIVLFLLLAFVLPSFGGYQLCLAGGAEKYKKRTFEEYGRLIDEIVVPERPPKDHREPAVEIQEAAGDVTLPNAPAFDWSYGCSATAAAMMMGFYDRQGYSSMYSGPGNGGVCPLTNAVWGPGECPLSATHIGIDGRAVRGNVDDYWIATYDPGPDPYILNGWPEHASSDCTADFMGTSQSKYGNIDGGTTFFYYTDGSPLYDYVSQDPAWLDGCHGLRLFVASRGYTVTENFSQYIFGYDGLSMGFTFQDYMSEIDAGRPVIIHVAGHSMLGFGYNPAGSIIYLHDTWDYYDHAMTWGGSYSGMEHYGVTVLRLTPIANRPPIAQGETYSASAGKTMRVRAPGVLKNDGDPDGNPLAAVLVSYPGNGSLTFNVNGSFSYTPRRNFVGTDTFTYKASDGLALSAAATVTIQVTKGRR
jgi:hypothetical protein